MIRFTALTTVIILVFCSGCIRTEGRIRIAGKIIDEFTNDSIPGREVIVQALVQDGKKYNRIYAGQFRSDSSGNFNYSLNRIKDSYRYTFYMVGDSDYAYSDHQIGLYHLKKNAKYLSLTMSRLADLTINIFRNSVKPAYDTLYLSWKSDGVDGRTLYPYRINNHGLNKDMHLMWIGGEVNSTIETRVYADKRTSVRWVLNRNGTMREIIDTITCRRDRVNRVYLTY